VIGNVKAHGVGEMIVNDGGSAPVLTSSAARNMESIPVCVRESARRTDRRREAWSLWRFQKDLRGFKSRLKAREMAQSVSASAFSLITKRKKNLMYIANPRMRVCPRDTNFWILRSESSPMALRIARVKGVKWTVVVLR
jgi:hypothetical protein